MWVVRVIDCLVTLKLQGRCLTHGMVDNLGVVYPQYWLQSNAKESFCKHLNVIKTIFCHPQANEQN
jgi:hypothetical protein